MKSKKSRVVALILLAVIIGGAIWLILRTPEYVATATISVIPASKADAPKTVVPVAPVAQVELPKAPAVAAGDETSSAPSAPDIPAPDTTDPQTDLKTAIPELARMIKTGEASAFYTPDDLAKLGTPEFIQQWKNASADGARDPVVQKGLEVKAEAYEALENQIPTINDAGNEATYQITLPTDSDYKNGTFSGTGTQQPLTFIKIGGKWYIKHGK